MKWKKKGLIASPKQFNLKWWNSYGMDPCTLKLNDNILEYFFAVEIKKYFSYWIF